MISTVSMVLLILSLTSVSCLDGSAVADVQEIRTWSSIHADFSSMFSSCSWSTYIGLVICSTIASAVAALLIPEPPKKEAATYPVLLPVRSAQTSREPVEIPGNYKTVMCRNIGTCKFAERCHFAHSVAELRVTPRNSVSSRTMPTSAPTKPVPCTPKVEHIMPEPVVAVGEDREAAAKEMTALLRVDSRFACTAPAAPSMWKPARLAQGPKGQGFDPSHCIGRMALARLRSIKSA